MEPTVLLVDHDEDRRARLERELGTRGVRPVVVADAVHVFALGRAREVAVMACLQELRPLTLRGLMRHAHREWPRAQLVAAVDARVNRQDLLDTTGLAVDLLAAGGPLERLAEYLAQRARRPMPPRVLTGTGATAVDGDRTVIEKTITRFNREQRMAQAQAELADAGETFEVDVDLGDVEVGTAAPADATLEGSLEDAPGSAVLALLRAVGAVGRLHVAAGPAEGVLYVADGDPVWVDPSNGDDGVWARLQAARLLRAGAVRPAVPRGQLLSALALRGDVSGVSLHGFMRQQVRERCEALLRQDAGAWAFVEDRAFLDTVPLVRVAVLPMLLDVHRRATPPARLAEMSTQLESRYVLAGPSLAALEPLVRPFLRGLGLATLADGRRTAGELLTTAGLDPLGGALVLSALAAARVITLPTRPRAAHLPEAALTETLEITRPLPALPRAIPEAEVPEVTSPRASADEHAASERILALYAALKPLTQPRAILGVTVHADEAAIDAAYHQRMGLLDATRIPAGSTQALLHARVLELRDKVEHAYETVKLLGKGPPVLEGQSVRSSVRRRNPF